MKQTTERAKPRKDEAARLEKLLKAAEMYLETKYDKVVVLEEVIEEAVDGSPGARTLKIDFFAREKAA